MIRSLSRIEIIALSLYLFWSLCGMATILFSINQEMPQNPSIPPIIQAVASWALRWGDAVMITLAAINAHFLAIRHWGIHQARRWALWVCCISGIVETCGALTGIPFGHYAYSDVLGAKLFDTLPLVIPLAWLAILTPCLFIIRTIYPYAPSIIHAGSASILATGIDWILEPYAVYIKGYWRWMDSDGDALSFIPLQNYFSWWMLSFLLIVLFAPRELKKSPDPRPWLIPSMMIVLFLLGRSLHS
jgi:uncharacterized membrane protein